MPRSPSNKNTQIYVGRIPRNARTQDLERAFEKFGRIKDLNMKNGYAFITYDDYRDADEAVQEMDNASFEGERLIVEPAGQKKRDRGGSPSRRPIGGGSRGPQPKDICRNCGKVGHWANECREERKMRDTRGGDGGPKCFRCGRRGHKQRDCRSSRGRSDSRSSRSFSSRSRSRSRSKNRGSRRNRSDSRSVSKDARRKDRKKRSVSSSGSRSKSPHARRSKSPADNNGYAKKKRASHSRSRSGSHSERKKSVSASPDKKKE